MAQNSWRLKKTLSRNVEWRPAEPEDMQHAWAWYKKGVFKNIAPKEMNPQQFAAYMEQFTGERYDAIWTFLAETKNGFIPIGFAAGYWSSERVQQFMILEALWWSPWASPRSIIESICNFGAAVKEEGLPMMAFVHEPDKRFMEIVAKHGIIRRVGTSYVAFPGERASVWEIGSK